MFYTAGRAVRGRPTARQSVGGGAVVRTDRGTNLSCLLRPQKAGGRRRREQRKKGLIYKLSAVGMPRSAKENRKCTLHHLTYYSLLPVLFIWSTASRAASPFQLVRVSVCTHLLLLCKVPHSSIWYISMFKWIAAQLSWMNKSTQDTTASVIKDFILIYIFFLNKHSDLE